MTVRSHKSCAKDTKTDYHSSVVSVPLACKVLLDAAGPFLLGSSNCKDHIWSGTASASYSLTEDRLQNSRITYMLKPLHIFRQLEAYHFRQGLSLNLNGY